MTQNRVEVGFICHRGNGHTQLRGEIDYGACGSKKIGTIYMEFDERDGLNTSEWDLQEIADNMADQVKYWSETAERVGWDEEEQQDGQSTDS